MTLDDTYFPYQREKKRAGKEGKTGNVETMAKEPSSSVITPPL
jgi:hypothetical protein